MFRISRFCEQFLDPLGVSDASQGVLHPLAVFGLVPEEKALLSQFLFLGFGAKNGFQSVRVVAGIIDLGGQGHGGGGEVLHLFQMIA